MKKNEEMSGVELREAVAVEVMGWRLDAGDWLLDNPHSGTNGGIEMPLYEADISAAFTVVEKMRAKGWHVSLCAAPKSGWCCTMLFEDFSNGPTVNMEGEGYWERQAYADAAPLAICRAALAAVRAK